jgi:hypothetical protein
MPTFGFAGSAIPGSAPSTPASQEPLSVGLPCLYSIVCSPKYQTFPCESWAYQSLVTSIGLP